MELFRNRGVTGLPDNFQIQQKDRFFNFIFKNNLVYCWMGKLSVKPETPLVFCNWIELNVKLLEHFRAFRLLIKELVVNKYSIKISNDRIGNWVLLCKMWATGLSLIQETIIKLLWGCNGKSIYARSVMDHCITFTTGEYWILSPGSTASSHAHVTRCWNKISQISHKVATLGLL